MAEPDDLVRLTRTDDGDLLVGRQHPGRGAWLCRRSAACLDKALRRGALTRALRAPVRPDAVERLRTLMVTSSPEGGVQG